MRTKPQAKTSEAKLIAYARVSTEFQIDSDSISQQIKDIDSFCELNGLPKAHIFSDEAVSAKVPLSERKGGNLFLNTLANEAIAGIIFTKLDRPFRTTGEALTYIDEWSKQGFALYIINFMGGKSLDTRDPITKAMLGMVSVFAEFERQLTAQRIADSLSRRKQSGKVYCKAVYGYKHIEGNLVPDDREQKAINIMKYLHSQGKPLREIAKYLNGTDLPLPRTAAKWHHSTVDKILKNPLHK